MKYFASRRESAVSTISSSDRYGGPKNMENDECNFALFGRVDEADVVQGA
jgi:hypothetical protein